MNHTHYHHNTGLYAFFMQEKRMLLNWKTEIGALGNKPGEAAMNDLQEEKGAYYKKLASLQRGVLAQSLKKTMPATKVTAKGGFLFGALKRTFDAKKAFKILGIAANGGVDKEGNFNVDGFPKGSTAEIQERDDGGYLIKRDAKGGVLQQVKIWEKKAKTEKKEEPKETAEFTAQISDIQFHIDPNGDLDQHLSITWTNPPSYPQNTELITRVGDHFTTYVYVKNNMRTGLNFGSITREFCRSVFTINIPDTGFIPVSVTLKNNGKMGPSVDAMIQIREPLLTKLKAAKKVYNALGARGGISNVDRVVADGKIKMKTGAPPLLLIPGIAKDELDNIINALK